MPNPNDFSNKEEFLKVCIPMMIGEGREQDQAMAACSGMWEAKGMLLDIHGAVKLAGDNELDVLAIPFDIKDADKQWFDSNTDVMENIFDSPAVMYQHSIAQGGKQFQDHPIVIGKVKNGSLQKKSDGWHIRVILDKTVELAKSVIEAAKRGLVAVSSGTIDHLARLEIGGKLVPYDKTKPGRIAVWPFAEISLWEKGNGNFQPANRFAIAAPAMKSIYEQAGIMFPDLPENDETMALEKASKIAKKNLQKQSRSILSIIEGD